MLNLTAYRIVRKEPWRGEGAERIEYKHVPIEHLTEATQLLRAVGLTYRVRYRGTRTHRLDTRSRTARMQDCLKRFADRATIYIEG